MGQVDPAQLEQLDAAEHHEEHQGQTGGEGQHQQVGGQEGEVHAVLQDQLLGPDAVHVQGGVQAAEHAEGHHDGGHQLADLALIGQGQGDGGHDDDDRGALGAEGGQDVAEEVHHPGDQGHPAAHQPQHAGHHQVNGPVAVEQVEEVGDAHQDDKQLGVDAVQNGGNWNIIHKVPDNQGRDKAQDSQVRVHGRADGEDCNQHNDG